LAQIRRCGLMQARDISASQLSLFVALQRVPGLFKLTCLVPG
jgi:hypothetical protein